MFAKHQKTKAYVEKTGVNPIISLQRYYNTEQEHVTRRIPIRIEEDEEPAAIEAAAIEAAAIEAAAIEAAAIEAAAIEAAAIEAAAIEAAAIEAAAIEAAVIEPATVQPKAISVNSDIQTWEDDPLRLCLKDVPQTPASTTPTLPPPVILSELYNEEEHAQSWLYSRDPDSAMSSMSSLFDTQSITDETWEAIFHPLSTFKHKKGELEYLAWNPSNLPAAAARVAYRVMHARAFAPESDIIVSEAEPTFPTLMPSPPLKPSPVLSDLTLETDSNTKYYFDMLKNIRGDEPRETPRILKRSLLDMISTKRLDESYVMEDETPATAQAMMDPEICSNEKNRYWTEKRLFWFGFVCPLLWFYGSYYIRAARKSKDPTNLIWQRKCRLASIYFSVILSVVILVAAVKAAGSAGVRQAQSGTIRAVIAN